MNTMTNKELLDQAMKLRDLRPDLTPTAIKQIIAMFCKVEQDVVGKAIEPLFRLFCVGDAVKHPTGQGVVVASFVYGDRIMLVVNCGNRYVVAPAIEWDFVE